MAMEMHMVWEAEGGEVAVIGTFIDVDDGTGKAGDCPSTVPSVSETTTPEAPSSTPARRSATQDKISRRNVAKDQADKRRQLPGIGGSFFHVNAPTTSSVTPSKLLETVFNSVEEIATPGTVTETKPLVMSELVNILTSGSFQT